MPLLPKCTPAVHVLSCSFVYEYVATDQMINDQILMDLESSHFGTNHFPYRDQLGSPDAELQFSVPQPSGPVLSRRVKDADLVTALEDIQRLSSSLLKMEKNS